VLRQRIEDVRKDTLQARRLLTRILLEAAATEADSDSSLEEQCEETHRCKRRRTRSYA
jgi:hypothetical protein